MTSAANSRLRVHPDLRVLVAPYSEKIHSELKDKLILQGHSTPIRAWENTILVDYEVFEICQAHDIPITISRIRLGSVEEAVAWICKNQLLRKDIPEKMRHYLIGKRFLAEKALGAHEAAKGRNSPNSEMTTIMLESSQKKDVVPTAIPTGTIKDMPAYDPDGEVCSLALTIPSWIGSINRTQSVSDFSIITESARAKLIYELDRLVYTCEGIRAALTKEAYHGRSE